VQLKVVLLVAAQVPVAAWHRFVVLEQVTDAPMHTPDAQTSFVVQPFPSLQGVPFVTAGFEQPLEGLHVPAEWH